VTGGVSIRLLTTAAAALVLCPSIVHSQVRAQVLATGFSSPLQFVQDPLSPDVTYIVEQGGLVQTLRNGARLEPFIDLRGSISSGGERGLLGMAFDPNTASGRVYFNFTNQGGDTVVARFRRSAATPLGADPASRFDLRWPTGERVIRQPFANHNGGNLVFGPDGYLYIGLGDGGSSNDPQNRAQTPSSLLGKMLRIDVAVGDADANGYRVPPDNPFADAQPIGALGEIWDFGLRNPWRYSFDDVGGGATGALIIADVGQNAREEINYEPFGGGGRNYGWRLREGSIATPGVAASAPAFGPLVDPILDYPRSMGQSITGGYVYRGTALGQAYAGRYFFADYVTSRVWSLGLAVNAATGEATATDLVEHTAELGGTLGGIASFGRDFSGELYLLTFSGRVLKIVGDAASNAPSSLAAMVNGSAVMLSWSAPSTGAVPAAYQIEAGSAPGLANLAVHVSTGPQISATFSGVPSGVYFVRVRSVVSGQPSGPSNEAIVTVGADCSQAPAPPSVLTATTNGRRVTLSWQQASTASGPATFRIEAGDTSGAANLAVLTLDGSLRAFTGDVPPGSYFVRVRGVNACGVSGPSNEIVVTVF
jgi:glucose/arabinose dehydrogenase